MNELTQFQEIEAKFLIQDPDRIRQKLLNMGSLVEETTHLEKNIIFDTPDHQLESTHQVLRIRQANKSTLTYKSLDPLHPGGEQRREIQVAIDDLEAGIQILSSLGFHPLQVYEKYRTTYQYSGSFFMLDRLPYGNFLEIESKDLSSLQEFSSKLELNWDKRIKQSYLSIFNSCRNLMPSPPNGLLFSNSDVLFPPLEKINIFPADI